MEIREKHVTTRDELQQENTAEPINKPAALQQRSRKRNILVFSIVTAVNIGLIILLATQLFTPATKSPAADGQGTIPSPLIGKAAPDFTLQSLADGKQLRLSDLKGKMVILNFWGSWCAPCQQEAPALQKAWQERLQQKGVVLLGIDVYEDSSAAHAFIKKYGISYQNVQDTLNGNVGQDYGIRGYPETFFISADGKVLARYGPFTEETLDIALKKFGL
ncbi:cytochrome c biogenesis protein CcmG/thiol:disulfide interchange protein DsbE [Thermosporothrix hazakensis]|jgi:cytochrome c biogenesis protein CcmG/thiol:disulfide interchange protein DsbE|uniref:Cytochrome c biogenesis protein CcmG/thiol:disulfide interchange protein DsbE n=1 Tax=Thermosporothrix hazakensis TaxID=644383 RepID=A0A326U0L2_THEHA|nr:TlpA disulfide reductase family protein [Thermosporothrix hazakensis]PZW23936.1 cytochrome c biogenesis protein CcmG/thiol:disulfide interchange protein DsbE [Thermosporothrix hazakensis]GCE48465.1 hypothetical protein KTH_33340 [Thermosporothrix hazakensis]